MVLQKRLDYGFNDYQAPATPRTIRSTRRRVNFQRRAEDNQMCAFDLLATLAGKLLQEKENTTMYSDTSSEKDQCGYVKEYQAANKSEDSCFKLDGDTTKVKDELHKFEKVPIGNGTEMCSFEDPLDENPPALISLGGNAKLSGCTDRNPCSSSAKGYDNVPVVNRDDDENSSGCTHPNTKTKSFRPKTCTYDNRIGNILASKFRKVAEKSKDDILSNSDLRQTYRIKKNCCKRQSSQMNIPFKKRKLYNCSSFSNSNRFISSGGIYYSPEHGMNQDASGSTRGMHKDLGISSSEASQPQTLQCRSSRVKRRIPIKSFRVPELFIEVPETATIGSLKRTVMDAVTAVLGDGLRIGVILQGKKVRDDSKTLLQTGISHDNQLDALGFTLEPNSSQSLPIACAAHFPSVPSADIPQPLIRYPSSPAVTRQRIQRNSDMLPEHEIAGFGNLVESDQDSAPSTINRFNTSVDKGRTDSKGLVIAPEMDKEELAMLTVHQKSKRSEIVQRRIRRPFSVDEVEALVHAVEKLGTGRWRDVKLLAFDNAKHRTYVDLKDKWKTLVHTARISPQQRRGEPVPQKLLDRVLTAHAYWSQQQDKPQHKQLPETAFFNKGLSPARGFVDGG